MALATLADLKAYLGLKPDDTTADAMLTRILDYASTAFERALQRTLALGGRAETRSGNGADRMLVRDFPVASVSSVKVDGVEIPAAVGTGPGFVAGKGEGDPVIYLRGYRFTLGVLNIELAYTAGYATTPADIVHAVIEISAQAYKEKDWIGFISKALAGETVTFDRAGVPNSAKHVLATYARRWPCD